jgi:hypothetical protein
MDIRVILLLSKLQPAEPKKAAERNEPQWRL